MSTGSLKATVVPLGRSFTFPIESSAFGVVPLSTICSLAFGVFLSASVGFLVTNSDKGFYLENHLYRLQQDFHQHLFRLI